MANKFVDANYRYIAAYQEVNARISQRQQALALYLTLVVSLLAALVALRPAPGGAMAPVEWLIVGFPVASFALALMNYTSERAISNLRTFLSGLERLENAHLELPSYNTEPRWSSAANKARRYRDLATCLFVIAGNAMGLGAAWKIYPDRLAEYAWFMWGSVTLAVGSILVLLITQRFSYRPATG
ncbi:MAG TPA: hypothetical protein VM553_08835 [Dongiaceae bacterium]|nr:hypothetical protein [Dongiaceae bacterium]